MSDSNPVPWPKPLGVFAGQLLARAREYLDAFDRLADEAKLTFPDCFLLAHSLELFLKAFLASTNFSADEVHEIGHDLVEILAECEHRAIPDVPLLRALVAHIGMMNDDHSFRYPTDYLIQMPRKSDCIRCMLGLANAISPVVMSVADRANLRLAADTRHLRPKKFVFATERPNSVQSLRLPKDLVDKLKLAGPGWKGRAKRILADALKHQP